MCGASESHLLSLSVTHIYMNSVVYIVYQSITQIKANQHVS